MSCRACSKRKSVRLQDTTQNIPINKPAPNATNSAQEQGNRLRGKLRFTGR